MGPKEPVPPGDGARREGTSDSWEGEEGKDRGETDDGLCLVSSQPLSRFPDAARADGVLVSFPAVAKRRLSPTHFSPVPRPTNTLLPPPPPPNSTLPTRTFRRKPTRHQGFSSPSFLGGSLGRLLLQRPLLPTPTRRCGALRTMKTMKRRRGL